MSRSFEKYAAQLYSHFMKYTLSNSLVNSLFTLIENITILFIIDFMFTDAILSEVFTPFYFFSPHLYLDLLNERLVNQCNQIFTFNTDSTIESYKNFTTNTEETQIIFFKQVLLATRNSYCLYSDTLVYASSLLILVMIIFLILLSMITSRGKGVHIVLRGVCYFLTNSVNLIMRTFSICLIIIFINRPILILYQGGQISSEYMTREIMITLLSVVMLIITIILCSLNLKFINNIFHFETLPYSYFSTGDAHMLLVIKILIGMKINFDKLNGLNVISFIKLIIGVFIFIRMILTLCNRNYIVNHVYLKNFTALFSLFYGVLIVLKLINQSFEHFQEFNALTLVMEIVLIVTVLIVIVTHLFRSYKKFVFRRKNNFITESFKLMYYVSRNLAFGNGNGNAYKDNKTIIENFIDNIIIGHKMKCRMEDCILCCEDIYNPDLKTLLIVLYQQFLKLEKHFKEENEAMTLILKILYLHAIDRNKIHRISFIILKNLNNTKLSLAMSLKIRYIYEKLLDLVNEDQRNLIQMKYSEIYEALGKSILNFEDILGFIKSRTEKIELVINKTNQIGDIFSQLEMDMFFLKRNRRIFFDPANLLQIICIIRLVFHKNIDVELTENLEYSCNDFLDTIDKMFAENISFLVRYDFAIKTWRMKKVPKKFIDITNYKISELLDQSLEKIFPRYLAKSIVKKLEEEIILSNAQDERIEFRTVVTDSDTNARYVKFDIDIIPSLENNYILLMHCHFHRRQLLIIDEFGNFVNGSHVLYEKIGINAEIVARSKGRINMFTMFNLDKKQKLEDVKIVPIESEGILDTTKKMFLLEGEGEIMNTCGKAPGFLETFIKNEAERAMNKEKNVLFLHLFYTEVINDVKYFVYNIKINSTDDKKKTAGGFGNEPQGDKQMDDNKVSPPNKTVTIKRLETNFSNSSDDRRMNQSPYIKQKDKKQKGNDDSPEKDNVNTYQNYLEYYNCFYDTHRSMSMTMDYKSFNLNSHDSSQNNSANSDVFGYLYLKSINNNKYRTNKFETFLYGIFIFSIVLVVYAFINIIYIDTYSRSSAKLLQVIDLYYKVSSGIYSATCNFFPVMKFTEDESESDSVYSEYLMTANVLDYDHMIKTILLFQSDYILTMLNEFNKQAYDFFGASTYSPHLAFGTYYAHLDSNGGITVTEEKITSVLDLFAVELNELATLSDMKVFFNISYLDFQYDRTTSSASYLSAKLTSLDPNNFSNEDKNYFTKYINLYNYLFNYFNSYFLNLNTIKDFLVNFASSHFDILQTNIYALYIVLVIFNILFILVCLFSILIYKKIITKEFNTLYSIGEDHIMKLKEKYQYVRELIKWEQQPSRIYAKLRKMKEEVEMKNLENSKAKKAEEVKKMKMENQMSQGRSMDDSTSVMTNNSQSAVSDYLKFSGAMKGLYRSSTLKAIERMDKLRKESNKQKVNLYLLKRLNFDFEMIKFLLLFIVFVSLGYMVSGIAFLFILEMKYTEVSSSIRYTELFQNMTSLLFNYHIAVKLSIMLNKSSPYSLYDPQFNPDCITCNNELFTYFSNITWTLNKMEATTSAENAVYNADKLLQGSGICDKLFLYNSSLMLFLTKNEDTQISNKLMTICQGIAILRSNVDSIFTNMMVNTMQIYNLFISSDRSIQSRISFLSTKFKETDILLSLFAQFYFEYISNSIVESLTTTIVGSYYSFMIAIYSVNIFIDFLLILFIWFSIYKKIIKSVGNVQLVTDSVENV